MIIEIKKNLLESSNIIIGGDFNVIPEEIDDESARILARGWICGRDRESKI